MFYVFLMLRLANHLLNEYDNDEHSSELDKQACVCSPQKLVVCPVHVCSIIM